MNNDKHIQDIVPIEKALDKLESISGYTYTKKNKEDCGLIAEELINVLPQSVAKHESAHYLNINGPVALLVEAVKELKLIVDKQREEIELLKKKKRN